jgi:predicted lipid-binding transport protein (Tim44 family)
MMSNQDSPSQKEQTSASAGTAEEPPDAPERRLLRGCLVVILLLGLVLAVNFFQYGLNIVTIVSGVLLLVAVAARIVIGREARGQNRGTTKPQN